MSDSGITVQAPGFFSLLALVFITLKLTGIITWSWWWVTAPLWGGLVLLLAICVVALVIICLLGLFTKMLD